MLNLFLNAIEAMSGQITRIADKHRKDALGRSARHGAGFWTRVFS